MKKVLVVMVLAMVLAWGVGAPKAEAYMIDFGIDYNSGDNGGTICYSAGTLTGTDIEIDNAVAAGYNSLNFASSSTTLNFSMTNATYLGGGNYSFTGGTIEIVSTDGSVSNGTAVTLLSGSWDSSQVVSLYTLSDGTMKIMFGGFNDSKNEMLLSLLRIDSYQDSNHMIPGFVGGLNLQFLVPAGSASASCSAQVYSGDVTNSSVPIPAAAWLFGSGILGFIGIRRRTKKSPKKKYAKA
jgi:hypothetical protein